MLAPDYGLLATLAMTPPPWLKNREVRFPLSQAEPGTEGVKTGAEIKAEPAQPHSEPHAPAVSPAA